MFFTKKKHKQREIGRIVIGDNSSGRDNGYSRLKDNVLYLNADGKNKVIQVESSMSSEGKTTVACNLAVSLGLMDKRVIVLDLDFRRPSVHRLFDISKENGISEYMLGDIDYKSIVKSTAHNNVEVITRGAEIHNSSLVLVSEKFKNLIQQLRDAYDYVILDCPPVLQVSDYIHISKVSDGVLFIVAFGQTTKAQAAETVRELRKNGANVLGAVVTKYDWKKDKNFSDINYGYYYNYAYEADEK